VTEGALKVCGNVWRGVIYAPCQSPAPCNENKNENIHINHKFEFLSTKVKLTRVNYMATSFSVLFCVCVHIIRI